MPLCTTHVANGYTKDIYVFIDTDRSHISNQTKSFENSHSNSWSNSSNTKAGGGLWSFNLEGEYGDADSECRVLKLVNI